MRNLFTLIGISMTMALSMGGCALAGDGDEASTDGVKGDGASAEAFEYTPEDADLTLEERLAEKVESTATAKSGTAMYDLHRDYGFQKQIYLPQGVRVTCTTSNGTSGTDTVLALIRRNDRYADYWLQDMPGSQDWGYQGGIQTLDQDDDGAGFPYSSISYQNPGGEEHLYLVGFAYQNRIGYADVRCSYSDRRADDFWSQDNFRAGSYKGSCAAGAAHVESREDGADSTLIVISATDDEGSGIWNEDNPHGGSWDAHVHGLTNREMWYVMWAYGDNEGTSSLHCGDI